MARLLSRLFCEKTTKPSLWQIQIDPFVFRQYINLFQLVNHCFENLNRTAVIFYDRIESRYLKPVRHIASDNEIGEFSGFSILAIDCLIIETLNQFYNGLDETKGKHWKAFWYVFKNSPHFKPSFSPKKAETFYGHFRCGILHQAQTKANSVVRICRPKMIEEVNPEKISDGLIVDREIFHKALESEIADYKQKLKSSEPEHKTLRDNFIKKMNYICNLK